MRSSPAGNSTKQAQPVKKKVPDTFSSLENICGTIDGYGKHVPAF